MDIKNFKDVLQILDIKEEKIKMVCFKSFLNKWFNCEFKIDQFSPQEKIVLITRAYNKDFNPEWSTPKFYETSCGGGIYLTKESADYACRVFAKEYEQAFNFKL